MKYLCLDQMTDHLNTLETNSSALFLSLEDSSWKAFFSERLLKIVENNSNIVTYLTMCMTYLSQMFTNVSRMFTKLSRIVMQLSYVLY